MDSQHIFYLQYANAFTYALFTLLRRNNQQNIAQQKIRTKKIRKRFVKSINNIFIDKIFIERVAHAT